MSQIQMVEIKETAKERRNRKSKAVDEKSVGIMLRRRRSCRKKQLRLKLSTRDAEGCRS
jgi:hypothetical protein